MVNGILHRHQGYTISTRSRLLPLCVCCRNTVHRLCGHKASQVMPDNTHKSLLNSQSWRNMSQSIATSVCNISNTAYRCARRADKKPAAACQVILSSETCMQSIAPKRHRQAGVAGAYSRCTLPAVLRRAHQHSEGSSVLREACGSPEAPHLHRLAGANLNWQHSVILHMLPF